MNKKISDLTAATTPLAGTELLEIVQGGTSKKVAASDLGVSAITVKDEGTNLTTALTSLDFVGAGVTATNTGGAVTVTVPSGSGSPGGSNTQIQYNNSGSFAGSSSFTWDESTKSLKVRGSIEAFRDDSTQADIYSTTYGVNGGGVLHGRMANGTYASPTAILAGDVFGGVGSRAYHSGGAFQTSSPTSIHWVAAENQTSTAYGSHLAILTTPKGSTTRQERLVVTHHGGLWAHDASASWDAKNDAHTSPFTSPGMAQVTVSATGATQTAQVCAVSYGLSAGAGFRGGVTGGTVASPSATAAGTMISFLSGHGYGATGWVSGAKALVALYSAESWTDSASGAYASIATTPKGSTTRQERVVVSDSGTLWCHDTGTYDPTVSAQTAPFSDTRILASGVVNTSFSGVAYGTGLTVGLRGGSATGTPASPGATGVDTVVCFVGGHFHDGTNWTTGAKALIACKAGQAITSSNQGSYITLETTPLNSTTRAEGARLDPDGNFLIQQAGKGLRVKEGSNAKQGTATLVAGAVTVSNTSVTANSRIFLTSQADGGTPGWLRVSARSAGTSFTITSSSGTDTSTVAYQIFEPA